MGALLLIIVLGLVVIVHEFGHFLFAKKFGIRVDEFGVGFPPRAKTLFKKGETTYTLNWIPFGGFVKIFGENPDDAPKDSPDYSRSMIAKPRYKQALVLLGGVLFNFLLGWLLISVGYMTGFPTSVDSNFPREKIQNVGVIITSVSKDSPAVVSGITPGDKIVSIDNTTAPAQSIESVQSYIQSHGGTPVVLVVTHGSATKTLTVTPKEGIIPGKAAMGVSLDLVGTVTLSPLSAIGHGFSTTWNMTKDIAVYFVKFVAGFFNGQKSNLDDVAGPVGIAGIAGDAFHLGFAYLLSFIAIISVNLAVLNLMPFPALDGGRLLFLAIEAIRGKRIGAKTVMWTNTVGFGLLILLMLVVTYHDIVKLF